VAANIIKSDKRALIDLLLKLMLRVLLPEVGLDTKIRLKAKTM